ncbi:MAG: hypothetical protein IT431_01445 [Phycisphaerales bacterium]|nr:hypothetical protein [Phycisphaerales bacterium]
MPAADAALRSLTDQFLAQEATIRTGGGKKAIERQHEKGRLTARERVARLVDPAGASTGPERKPGDAPPGAPPDPHGAEIPNFQELGLWSAFNMYAEHGGAPAAGVVTGVGIIHGRPHMIIANDATVKAGAFFPMTCKKIIRAQHIARTCRLPLVYLVDSAGVFLPLQEDVFPDTDDFGRIFYLNSVISAEGIPQVAAIMGYCVAGGGYLPVLCETLLMTEGSGLYLAGPALVKAAIGQTVTDEELGGATMHAEISGTIDFKEPDDEACLRRLRQLLGKSASAEPTDINPDDPQTWGSPDDPSVLRHYAARVLAAAHSERRRSTAELMDIRLELEDVLSATHQQTTPASTIHLEALRTRLRSLADREFAALSEGTGDERSQAELVRRVRDALPSAPEPTTSRRAPGPSRDPLHIYETFTDKPGQQYDIEDIIACIVDARAVPNSDGHESLVPDFDEYRKDHGCSIVCGYAKIGGRAVGIVANQGKITQHVVPGAHEGPKRSVHMPKVIYHESANKAARFIMDCNQRKIPLVFLHDTTGFMVGRDAEQGGIIRTGAKMVNAVSNCVVPKIVVIMGGSYGAGNYAMCGRAFEQTISLAWPCAKCAVMGAAQATGTLAMIEERSRERKGQNIDPETHKQILDAVRASYNEQQDIRHGAARGWVDRIIQPHRTRDELIAALRATANWDYSREFKTGVLQT